MSTKAQQIRAERQRPDSEFPEGWSEVVIADIGRLHCGQSPAARFVNTSGKGTLYITGPDQWDGQKLSVQKWTTDPRRLVGDGCVFVTVKGAGVGKIFPGVAGAIGRDVYAFEPHPGISYQFVMHALELTIAEIKWHAAGDIPGLSKDHLLEHTIGLPPSREQQRIVIQVDSLLQQVNTTKLRLSKIPTLLRHFRQAVLAAACSGKLTEDWRKQHPKVESASALVARTRSELGRGLNDELNTALDELQLAGIPDSWTWTPTAHIGAVRGGIQKQPKRAPKKNAYPYLRVANVLRNRLDLAEIHRMELFGNELQTYKLEPGDLLIIEGNGSLNEIGRSALWAGQIQNCVHQNHIIRVRLRGCLPDFVNAYWNSPLGIASIAQVAVTTAGLYSLSTQKIARIPVPVAPPEEQHEIVRCVDALFKLADAIEKRVAAATTRAEKLTQAILAKAFRGELVPTEAELARREGGTYEPASVLLDRIKAERDAATQKTPKRGNRAAAMAK